MDAKHTKWLNSYLKHLEKLIKDIPRSSIDMLPLQVAAATHYHKGTKPKDAAMIAFDIHQKIASGYYAEQARKPFIPDDE